MVFYNVKINVKCPILSILHDDIPKMVFHNLNAKVSNFVGGSLAASALELYQQLQTKKTSLLVK